MKQISVIIPCYNSEHTIRNVAEGILAHTKGRYLAKIILVNDCSSDHVWDEIRSLGELHKNVIGLSLSRNFGQQSARMAALPYVEGDYVVFMDDDGQHAPAGIISLIEKLEEGYDIVYAAFEKKEQHLWRTLGSNFNRATTEWFAEKPKGIRTSSFFATRKFVVDALADYQSPAPFVFGYLMKTTQNIASVPLAHHERVYGKSGYSLKKLIRLWVTGAVSFSTVPLRLSSIFGFVSAFAGIIGLIVIVIRKLLRPEIPAGYTSMLAVVLLFAGIILLMLGLIGEYIGRMFMTMNHVPQYVVKEKINAEGE